MQLRSRLLIAVDDTDTPDEGGTGHVARTIAQRLAASCPVWGVTRHQFAVLPEIPYTRRNSANVIHLLDCPDDPDDLTQQALAWLDELACEAAQPGLCVARPEWLQGTDLGHAAQVRVVARDEVRAAARTAGALLLHPRANHNGIIGAFGGACLAATGNDGRFVQVGQSRSLQGTVGVQDILDAGLDALLTIEGVAVTAGQVLADRLRPALRESRSVLYCRKGEDDVWLPIVGGPGDKESEDASHAGDREN